MLSHRTIHSRHAHFVWDAALDPAAVVAPGSSVEFDIQEASNGVIDRQAGADRIAEIDLEHVNPVTGPVFVEGAEAGDTLVVTLEEVQSSDWGWTAIIPGFGLLADQFPDPFLHVSSYDSERIEFTPEIHIPTRPFPGTIGVAPAEPGPHPMIPPHPHGGNMDVRHLTRGARIFLPVAVKGALFSVGDTHAAQGDGEVCGTAIESPMRWRIRLDVLKGETSRFPRIECDVVPPPGNTVITTGVHTDPAEAARLAVREMIDHLDARFGLSAEMAYCLVSVAGDVRFGECVNMPNWVVTAHLPLGIFR
jgi:acetamidase/formamidase